MEAKVRALEKPPHWKKSERVRVPLLGRLRLIIGVGSEKLVAIVSVSHGKKIFKLHFSWLSSVMKSLLDCWRDWERSNDQGNGSHLYVVVVFVDRSNIEASPPPLVYCGISSMSLITSLCSWHAMISDAMPQPTAEHEQRFCFGVTFVDMVGGS